MSGDLGSVDERGCLTILGRQKDLIIRGGHNIYPTEIEALAIKHPAINKAAAIPMPDARLGEKVCLAVLAEDDAELEGDEVLQHLHREGLSKYDMPEYFVRLEAFPPDPQREDPEASIERPSPAGRFEGHRDSLDGRLSNPTGNRYNSHQYSAITPRKI